MDSSLRKRKPQPHSKAKAKSTSHPTSMQPLLVTWDDLPPFLADNSYIRTHYRPSSHSYTSCLHSLTYLHNQTLNIYTQIFASLTLLSLSYLLFQGSKLHIPPPTLDDVVVFGCFFFGTVTCSVLRVWYTFPCLDRESKVAFILANLVAQCVTAYVALFVPVFRTPAWRPIRVCVFGLAASLAFVPLFAGLFQYGVKEIVRGLDSVEGSLISIVF
ncbi:hypothetical protein G7Y89_g14030 [Cudoniella acicularis]|uniref:Uncharacterized protein n=1 Tax=Cudoniella acicularis TaxID=354080 RepID=A0A8H4R8D6_9HELO|nr:hypothetical protein G7Y89_g14030 [Cudoniella acicularis]